jgi:hypothetical protein
VGSGIEHAEGGGSGDVLEGFQIWVNVPSARKMDAPRYGTEHPAAIPLLANLPGGAVARVLAGESGAAVGPFKTVTPVQIVDYMLPAAASLQHHVPAELDSALVFCYRGSGSVSGRAVGENSITLLDAASDERDFSLQSGGCVCASSACSSNPSYLISLQRRSLLHCFRGQEAATGDCVEGTIRHDDAGGAHPASSGACSTLRHSASAG